jgi:hypothetical protein
MRVIWILLRVLKISNRHNGHGQDIDEHHVQEQGHIWQKYVLAIDTDILAPLLPLSCLPSQYCHNLSQPNST